MAQFSLGAGSSGQPSQNSGRPIILFDNDGPQSLLDNLVSNGAPTEQQIDDDDEYRLDPMKIADFLGAPQTQADAAQLSSAATVQEAPLEPMIVESSIPSEIRNQDSDPLFDVFGHLNIQPRSSQQFQSFYNEQHASTAAAAAASIAAQVPANTLENQLLYQQMQFQAVRSAALAAASQNTQRPSCNSDAQARSVAAPLAYFAYQAQRPPMHYSTDTQYQQQQMQNLTTQSPGMVQSASSRDLYFQSYAGHGNQVGTIPLYTPTSAAMATPTSSAYQVLETGQSLANLQLRSGDDGRAATTFPAAAATVQPASAMTSGLVPPGQSHTYQSDIVQREKSAKKRRRAVVEAPRRAAAAHNEEDEAESEDEASQDDEEDEDDDMEDDTAPLDTGIVSEPKKGSALWVAKQASTDPSASRFKCVLKNGEISKNKNRMTIKYKDSDDNQHIIFACCGLDVQAEGNVRWKVHHDKCGGCSSFQGWRVDFNADVSNNASKEAISVTYVAKVTDAKQVKLLHISEAHRVANSTIGIKYRVANDQTRKWLLTTARNNISVKLQPRSPTPPGYDSAKKAWTTTAPWLVERDVLLCLPPRKLRNLPRESESYRFIASVKVCNYDTDSSTCTVCTDACNSSGTNVPLEVVLPSFQLRAAGDPTDLPDGELPHDDSKAPSRPLVDCLEEIIHNQQLVEASSSPTYYTGLFDNLSVDLTQFTEIKNDIHHWIMASNMMEDFVACVVLLVENERVSQQNLHQLLRYFSRFQDYTGFLLCTHLACRNMIDYLNLFDEEILVKQVQEHKNVAGLSVVELVQLNNRHEAAEWLLQKCNLSQYMASQLKDTQQAVIIDTEIESGQHRQEQDTHRPVAFEQRNLEGKILSLDAKNNTERRGAEILALLEQNDTAQKQARLSLTCSQNLQNTIEVEKQNLAGLVLHVLRCEPKILENRYSFRYVSVTSDTFVVWACKLIPRDLCDYAVPIFTDLARLIEKGYYKHKNLEQIVFHNIFIQREERQPAFFGMVSKLGNSDFGTSHLMASLINNHILDRDFNTYVRESVSDQQYLDLLPDIVKQVAAALHYLHNVYEGDPICHQTVFPGLIRVSLEKNSDGVYPVWLEANPLFMRREKLVLKGAVPYLSNRQYAAPEQQLFDTKVTHKSDIYAFGIVLGELIMRMEHDVVQVIEEYVDSSIIRRTKPKFFSKIELARSGRATDILVDLYERCTQYDPNLRPEMAKVLVLLNQPEAFTQRRCSASVSRTLMEKYYADATLRDQEKLVAEYPDNSQYDYVKDVRPLIRQQGGGEDTPAKVKRLLTANSAALLREGKGITALLDAISYTINTALGDMLLKDCNVAINDGTWTPLAVAVELDNQQWIKWCLLHQADVDKEINGLNWNNESPMEKYGDRIRRVRQAIEADAKRAAVAG